MRGAGVNNRDKKCEAVVVLMYSEAAAASPHDRGRSGLGEAKLRGAQIALHGNW